ncbi:MAG: aldolase/citrate lyase family protein, partial [Opitutales bacterium]|nr:aldolase/citrate lyase family protein [Opitutales bacterium]
TDAETFLVVQIETPEAVDNVDAIASIEGVDGLFIGSGDLGFRLKQSPDYPDLEACIETVAAAAKKHNKVWGLPVGTADDVRKRKEQGALLMPRGGEVVAMMRTLAEWGEELDEVLG